MMGRQANDQGRLFDACELDAVVPGDHLLRGIDAALGVSGLRHYLAPPLLVISFPLHGDALAVGTGNRQIRSYEHFVIDPRVHEYFPVP